MAIIGGINPNAAASAYSSSQNITGGAGKVSNMGSNLNAIGIGGGAESEGISFSDFLKQNVTQSIDTMKAGEDMSAKAVSGKADLTDVVQSVTAAELTLQTVVAVRDRMISAYQDIMRMPI